VLGGKKGKATLFFAKRGKLYWVLKELKDEVVTANRTKAEQSMEE